MKDTVIQSDDTKARLIMAAGEEFALHGYRDATVRDICRRAGAHVGSVNYHFRDKEGLYKAVLAYSHQSAIQKYPSDMGVDANAAPEKRLYAIVRSLLLRILADGLPAWHGKLMAQEMANPTGLMQHLVQSAIRPLHAQMGGIIQELFQKEGVTIEFDSTTVFLSAMSIVGQCLHHFKAKQIIETLRPRTFDPADIEILADHITRFSIGGIGAMAKEEKSHK
jgi:AcrR family transcriptional regulator